MTMWTIGTYWSLHNNGTKVRNRSGALWERGYFVMNSGEGTTDEMIRRYIKEQRNPMVANDKPTLLGGSSL